MQYARAGIPVATGTHFTSIFIFKFSTTVARLITEVGNRRPATTLTVASVFCFVNQTLCTQFRAWHELITIGALVVGALALAGSITEFAAIGALVTFFRVLVFG